MIAKPTPWLIAGSYYEACNCEAICPCRQQNGVPGGRSTHGVCQFLLSWSVLSGHAGTVDLSGLTVAMAGFYSDDEDQSPWRVMLFVDADADEGQFEALSSIFLGKAGGDIHFTSNIRDLLELRRARIVLDHSEGRESIRVDDTASAAVVRQVDFDGTVTCGIPGHGRPGQESVSRMSVTGLPLQWSYESRCGFATDFEYSA